MEIMTSSKQTTLQKFFSGANILITGGTGFIGKTLVEKLLRTCPDINTIYLIIRSKKGKDMQTRLEEIFEDSIFQKLHEQSPKFRHKLQAVSGDVSMLGLALNERDRQHLMSEVSIVFHVAATVKFDEKLRYAAAINVTGTKEMLKLCKGMRNLKSVMHVSTAYSHCPTSDIDEKFYESPIGPDELFRLLEAADDKRIDSMQPAILGKWPNTYTFTKAVAEEIVRTEGIDLPIGIFRPVIVISTYREPVRGWVDNMYGPTGICAGAGSGIIKTLHCDKDVDAQIVPVDMCVNAIIGCAWEISKRSAEVQKSGKTKRDGDIPIYNFVPSSENILSWGKFMDLCELHGVNYPTIRTMWYYCLTLNKYWLVHWLYVIFIHLIPAMFIDGVLLCLGKKPQLLKLNKKIMHFTGILSYFTTRNWKFGCANVETLWDGLEGKDKQLFTFDMSEVDWKDYFKDYMIGIRLYLLKEPMKTLPAALARWKKLFWIHQIIKLSFMFFILKFAYHILSGILL